MRLIDADALIRDIDGDLLDGIAEARAIEKIENAPTIGGWISVKDKLPTQQGEYLVNVIQYCLGGFELAWFDGKVWTAPDGEEYTDNPANNDNTIGKVTHWMPLPDAPKEGEGN